MVAVATAGSVQILSMTSSSEALLRNSSGSHTRVAAPYGVGVPRLRYAALLASLPHHRATLGITPHDFCINARLNARIAPTRSVLAVTETTARWHVAPHIFRAVRCADRNMLATTRICGSACAHALNAKTLARSRATRAHIPRGALRRACARIMASAKARSEGVSIKRNHEKKRHLGERRSGEAKRRQRA